MTAEQNSLLRLVVLYLVSLAGVVGVLAAGGNVLATLLDWLFGSPQTWSGFLEQSGVALAAALPLGVLWAYYGRILEAEMERFARRTPPASRAPPVPLAALRARPGADLYRVGGHRFVHH